jgi:phage protein D/phage baseplate assembly protein gpV
MATAELHVPLYEFLVDGQAIKQELADRVHEIKVEDSVGLPNVCTVQMGFPRPPTATAPHEIDKQPFKIGSKLVVKLGARESRRAATIFDGEVLTLEPEFGAGGVRLQVRAYDRTHRLHRSRHTKTWQNKTASDIIKEILQEHELNADCAASGAPFKFMQQSNETDWDFIWRLAERIGFELLVEGSMVKCRKPGTGEKVELTWSDPLHTFQPRVTAVQQVDAVTLAAFDPATKQTFESNKTAPNQIASIGVKRDDVKKPFGEHTTHIATAPVQSQAEGDDLAQSMLDAVANSYIAAEGAMFGDPRVRAGATIDVKGVGKQFSGTYRVQSSVHVLRGTYDTHFSSYPVASLTDGDGNGSSPDFGAGLVIGVVTNNNDPDKMGRVKVKYPVLGDEHEGNWARVATLSAGKERGLMMLPVPEEEVLIGFESGDVTRPYVVGSLFNAKDAPGEELAATDGSFGLRSDEKLIQRSKKDMIVSSDATMEVTIKGDVKELYEKKQETEVKMDRNHKVGANYKLEVTGSVEIKGGPSVKIESSGTMALKATQLDIEGSAMVNIKGGLINIG